jgi:hypothetical protein
MQALNLTGYAGGGKRTPAWMQSLWTGSGEGDGKETGQSFMGLIVIAKSFFHSGTSYNPPCPPLKRRGGTTRNCRKSPPLEKGDLGGFENLQGEKIYSKLYKPTRKL